MRGLRAWISCLHADTEFVGCERSYISKDNTNALMLAVIPVPRVLLVK